MPLPHKRTLKKCQLLSVMDENPGIREEAVASVKRKIKKSKHPQMVNELCIKKQIEWDGNQYVGFVNSGEGKFG